MGSMDTLRKLNDNMERSHRDLRVALDFAEGALDKETMEERRRADFNMPDDAELTVTVGTVRKIERLFELLNNYL